MKKIYNKLALLVAALMGMVMYSCSPDENDWNVDSSVVRQKVPASLEAEVDSVSLDIAVKIGSIPGAKSYEIQISTKALLSGYDETVGIPTFTTTETEYTIKRADEKLDEPITENTTYYLRVRAIDADGKPSKWYTNGMNYNEGYVSDAAVVALLKDNATYSVKSPEGLRIDDAGDTYIDLVWYMLPSSSSEAARAYCKAPSYIINETLKEAGEEESVYKHSLTATEISSYKYEWSDLAVNKPYAFTLYDEDDMKIGYVEGNTETTPNMSLARRILSWTKEQAQASLNNPQTLTDPDYGDFSVILNMDNSAQTSGYTKTGSYWCQTPDRQAYKSPYRFQSKNRNSLSFVAGKDGRLYLYTGSGTPYKIEYITTKYKDAEKTTPAKDEDGNVIQTTESGGTFTTRGAEPKVKIYSKETQQEQSCLRVTKIRLRASDPYGGKKDGDGYYTSVITKITPTKSASCYYYGFVFVPDDEDPGNGEE